MSNRKHTRGRGWSARYLAAWHWAPPEGIGHIVFCNVFTGRVWVRLVCGAAETTVQVTSEDQYEVGTALDDASMQLLMAADEPLYAVLDRAERTFERALGRIGGRK